MVNFHVLNDSVVLNYAGRTEVIAKTDKRYEKVVQAIRENRLDDIPALVEIERVFYGTGIELRDGLLYEGETPFPSELSDRIIRFKEEGLPFDALLKFWENLKKNPSYNARKALFAFLEHNGHPLTADGSFIAYRGVDEDFKDKHSRTFDNSPGKVCEMARELVDDNPNNTCSAGLHVACFEYAKSFGPKLVEVKVNPADVVCVPVDYDGTKMRTCKFEVIQECASIRNESLYGHSSPEVEADEEDEEEVLSPEDQATADVQDGVCPDCSYDILDDDKFCSNCGEDLEQYR
jgi:hypothetical protein